ncbi:MAG: acyltransferase domain-containing protein [Oscillospiraceae bacterium]|nr:acyltransferase domain-containing protein [Oscillospiraceae bacterium]MDD4367326.1 acyltransferase domain-containing protein [Oscillospiraceae bacterium]
MTDWKSLARQPDTGLYIRTLMQALDFPQQAQTALQRDWQSLQASPAAGQAFERLARRFLIGDYQDLEADLQAELHQLTAPLAVTARRADMLLLLAAAKPLYLRYLGQGYGSQLYLASLRDLRYKLLECWQVKGDWGTFVLFWYPEFYRLERFALGRFQYEVKEFPEPDYTYKNWTVRQGDPVLNLHIPSAGPLTKEDRLQSYRLAYDFYRPRWQTEVIAFTCHSWLLFPEHRLFLPPSSNIRDFMSDYEVIRQEEDPAFADGWRIFGADYQLDPSLLPRQTGLQRAYADWLSLGHRAGAAQGVFLYDGHEFYHHV